MIQFSTSHEHDSFKIIGLQDQNIFCYSGVEIYKK